MFRSKRPLSPSDSGIIFALQPTIGTDGRVPRSAQPWLMEPNFLNLFVLTPDGGFDSDEEAQAFYEQYLHPGQKPKFPKPTKPWHIAVDLAYGGWGKKSARRRKGVAQTALDISPDAVDAYLLLAHDAPSWEEAMDLENQALAAAERIMGPEYSTKYEDHFWGAAITRPYMRTRFALGYALWRQGARAEAAKHFQDLLRLNPNDNQGARYILAAILLEENRNGEAHRVMAKHSDDPLCYGRYIRALLQFRRKGDRPAARDLLGQALRRTPLVPDYLLGKQKIDSWELERVIMGEESEAIEYVHLYKEAWNMTEGAMEWLERLTR
ncbi:MAG: hypothetical protein KKD28_14710 [Chloroflexi bacterium]|nr:hypothetical protein [Chloroflexota bacterium]MBU1662711.1 hypothetical protein [Chloroflexota bacterium]